MNNTKNMPVMDPIQRDPYLALQHFVFKIYFYNNLKVKTYLQKYVETTIKKM